jgi:hypothetical protein
MRSGASFYVPCQGSQPPSPSPGKAGVEVAASDFLAWNAARALAPQPGEPVPILWLDRPVAALTGLSGSAAEAYGRWRDRCRALQYYEAVSAEDQKVF